MYNNNNTNRYAIFKSVIYIYMYVDNFYGSQAPNPSNV